MKILGYTDSVTECSCGKTNLKGTYAVETEDGVTLYLGSSCVKKKWGLTQQQFTSKKNDAMQQRRNERNAFMRPFDNKIDAIRNRYPNEIINKYTTHHEAHSEFMVAHNEWHKAILERNLKLPSLYIK